jgi:ankyrin repeat protein
MARKFGTYLICLLFVNYCLANPVAEGGESSKTPQDDNTILKGSHVLEFEESACDRAARLGSQLIAQVKLGSIKPFLQILWLGASVTLKDEQGNTALHYAAMGNTYAHCKMAVYLLACGADPKITNNEGDTPVHYAAHCPTMLNIFMKATCIQETPKQS